MSSIKNVFTFSHLHLLYDLFVLSMKITFAMTVAAFKMVIPPRAKNLIGETVLITGAGHGIGRELAIQLASLGCIIVCWDIDTEANRSTISMVSKNGGEAYGFVVDVSKRLEVREAARLMRKVGVPEVSILINNAAVLYHRPFLNQESDLVEKTFNVNVLSNFWTIETFLPSMIQNGKGHIVCVCSMCGIYGVSQKVAYCSSKFAMRGLMDALHEELRLDPKFNNIRFTTIYPFYVDTGLARDPKYRFPYIFGVISPEYAAKEIIKAFRRNYTEYSIPRCLFTLNSINRIVPETVMRLILDFLADVDRKRQEKLAICETNTS
ncbi:short-chain dehydrogenase/reductase family 16C member 6 [Apis cerana]|uniref:Short-chain dehydrogenase/reductase 3 n=1 Tax=Apis mellifera TaxID=7460 RepID=A0A7M7R7D2_APIME|nr:short-chain dehydrogenase/reductase family 16C member 6 [Apis cerana]XP_394814.1 short-chain dehydrogenase/reductase family 16C member 6 [Apis mellifera]KAG6801348.1 short-chain dehydrogenase/reductase family 16C member 6 [Apis mellifera caucasica]KAG9431316.1 short-chain dehydrogenase/reductase family 16C member 6 [Apis mellifera carnica]|eukprot:XP_394814.1 short-chain dehydrogenase/reductase family 16C member 6 [Apis mellifera]